MTTTPDGPAEPATEPDDGPVLVLPERAQLDPYSAAALALAETLPPMIEGDPEAWAIDMMALARATLDAVGAFPQIPQWSEPRTLGGANRGGEPEPDITVHVDGGAVVLQVATVDVHTEPEEDGGGRTTSVTTRRMIVAPADMRAWCLAGLAAAATAEATAPYVELAPDSEGNWA